MRRFMRVPIRTARMRLTLLYTGMFFVLGVVVVGATLGLSSSSSAIQVTAHPASLLVQPPNAPHSHNGSTTGTAPTTSRRGLTGLGNVLVAQHTADLRRLVTVSWLVLAITTVVSALLGWFVAGRMLRPLRKMTITARTISAGNLSERLALSGPDDEFKQLGDTLDELLARLEASFEAQRRFVANASHELRTPLTLERTLLQVALADPDASAGTLRATCVELLAAGRDQEQLLEGLLTLASSERGLEHRREVDLGALTGRALRSARSRIDNSTVQVSATLEPALTWGDAALLERLIANLIDNAVSYSDPGGRAEIRTGTTGAPDRGVFVSVSNTGALVPADQVQRLFEPFQRLGGARTGPVDGHHGLGLSIVRAIASAHGAMIDAVPGPDGGLAVTVTFTPADASSAHPPPRQL
jgi:signal transduction histidine kinase